MNPISESPLFLSALPMAPSTSLNMELWIRGALFEALRRPPFSGVVSKGNYT